jgi:hypothetical protein
VHAPQFVVLLCELYFIILILYLFTGNLKLRPTVEILLSDLRSALASWLSTKVFPRLKRP